MTLVPGTKLGSFEIQSPLGAGGMGEVYRARDSALDREVAVKVLPRDWSSDPDRLRRFELEARSAGALNHPNIVAVYSFGTTGDGVPYLVTELLQGQTLGERLSQGVLPFRKSVDYALQVANGLAAAHERGIVHRDLKPDNIFLTRDGLAKILDFGLAKLDTKALNSSSTLTSLETVKTTQPGTVLGTTGYMSPEQVRGQAVDQRADIFSFGAILYEMLSGERAFHRKTVADTMSAILSGEPKDLSTVVANLPPAMPRIVHRCLEKEADARFQSARDLAFSLELLSRDESGTGITAPPPSRRWPYAASALLLAVAALSLVAGFWLRTPKAPRTVSLRRLTDFVGVEQWPALSPDGKTVAFIADQGNRRQVWIRLLAGGVPLQVTRDDVDHESPRWSPDSSSLLYYTPAPTVGGQGEIWEIPALGGVPRPLVASISSGDMSHDGKLIAYLRSGDDHIEIAVANRDGSNPRVVASAAPEFIYSNLRWSPDDGLLAYQAGRTFDFDVFYVAASGGTPQHMTNDGNPLGGFAWLPDSSGVIYSSARGETTLYVPTMNLWEAHRGKTRLRQLTFGETSYLFPDVGANGDLVAARTLTQFDIWKYPVGGDAQESVRQAVRITHQTGNVQTPSVSPGDREIVYLSDSGGHGNLWVLNMASGETRQITFEQDAKIAVGVPVWSPDGQYISYAVRGRTGWNVDQWVIKPDGTGAHKVMDGGGWAAWSLDSRWLYLSPPTATGFSLEKVAIDGSQRQLVQPEGTRPAPAKDGILYFVINHTHASGGSDSEIRMAQPDNAPSKVIGRITSGREPTWQVIQPVLSPDGKWLAAPLVDGPTTNLWRISTSDGQREKIVDFGNAATVVARRVSWSSDGKSIYAAVGKVEADVVLLSNLLAQ